MEKFVGDIIILHMCTKITIIWFMVPAIWSATDRIFCHFGQFLALFPPMDPEVKILKKWKKHLKILSFYKMFTINDSHMIHGFSNMECNRQNFLSLWTVFCPFSPWQPEKSKFLRTEKKPWRYHQFTQGYWKSWSYPILFLRYGTKRI